MLTKIANFGKAWAITIIGWLIILVSFLTTSHAFGQELKAFPTREKPVVTCSLPDKTITENLVIPKPLMNRAIKKARLISLLRQSLHDDQDNKFDIDREKELKELAKQLSK